MLLVCEVTDPAQVGPLTDGWRLEPSEALLIDSTAHGIPRGPYRVHHREPPQHLGWATAWNIGARQIGHRGTLVVCDQATRFPDAARSLRSFCDRVQPGAYRTHDTLFVVTADVVRDVGLFDENFWPAAGTLIDYDRRLALAGREWTPLIVDAVLPTTPPAGDGSADAYYAAKWGGPPTHERWPHPFARYDRPDRDLRWWPKRRVRPSAYHDPRGIYEAVPDPWALLTD